MKVSMIIPAKGTSERLKNKNLYKINGKTLVRMACEKALECKNVHRVYLDTESESIILDIQDLLSKGLNLIRRPSELANNDISANDMMIYGLHSIEETDLIIQTFATSPLITSKTIDNCIEKFIDSSGYDSFFSVVKMQEYFWNENSEPINFDIKKLPNSFELDKVYMETHGVYGIYVDSLIKNKTRVGKRPLMLEIPKIESLDINDKDDLELIGAIYEKY
ncbi:acylneuraminate cytidylyltransferase family protein [Vibrio sp. ZSDE26]|uniref:Acylneuraminate cytidylyltransferase family protein n=1 Tax=Vibrio amylolyticus TaxID=2847292 RepID=A0A9X1XHW1_9VIBR|nr:acylneuraminate cytidylyltransferase family protein [Vibrio amylolyticus]MCK6263249.1 acylneuraminate cytidylyltransferase family protein [Vibrio amylolyticus]